MASNQEPMVLNINCAVLSSKLTQIWSDMENQDHSPRRELIQWSRSVVVNLTIEIVDIQWETPKSLNGFPFQVPRPHQRAVVEVLVAVQQVEAAEQEPSWIPTWEISTAETGIWQADYQGHRDFWWFLRWIDWSLNRWRIRKQWNSIWSNTGVSFKDNARWLVRNWEYNPMINGKNPNGGTYYSKQHSQHVKHAITRKPPLEWVG